MECREDLRVRRGRAVFTEVGLETGDSGAALAVAGALAFGAMQSQRWRALAIEGSEESEAAFEAEPVRERQWCPVKPRERVAGSGGGAEDLAKGMWPRTAIGEIIAHMSTFSGKGV